MTKFYRAAALERSADRPQNFVRSPPQAASETVAHSGPAVTVPIDRARVLGVRVSSVTKQSLLAAVDDAVTKREPTVFVGLYASLFRAIARDTEYRDLVRRSYTYPDGQGVVSELRRRGVTEATRLATTDVVHPIVRLAANRGWRVGLYGAGPGVAERAAACLAESAPGVRIVATWDGYSEGPSASELSAAQIDVLFVALGAGRQEAWAYDTGVASGVPAVLTCGGLLDFLAGDKRRAPKFMQALGLEWAFRVLLEPRRLFTRYLFGNTYFLRQARAERARHRLKSSSMASTAKTNTAQAVAVEDLPGIGSARDIRSTVRLVMIGWIGWRRGTTLPGKVSGTALSTGSALPSSGRSPSRGVERPNHQANAQVLNEEVA